MSRVLRSIKKIIPQKIFTALQPAYHFFLSTAAALLYRFPSRHLRVIGVTGTKGKTTVTELLRAILEADGQKIALSNSIRQKIGAESRDNTFKMTMPGRFFTQRFLREAANKKCAYAILEITSEGAKQFRNLFIDLDALVFTNLAPEHIESHGSYERYRDAKLSIARALQKSKKKRTFIVVNTDDAEAEKFLAIPIREKYRYALADAKPYELALRELSLTYAGTPIRARLSGIFNIYNILAAAVCATHLGIRTDTIKKAIEQFKGIPGRMEYIDEGQDFTVIVDYAHTPDSLKLAYQTFAESNKICVLGAAGGGRDAWKRKVFGSIANDYCSRIILTNEDPYDENPEKIVHNIQEGITKPISETIIDRREAIRKAFAGARANDVVIITGKGSEQYIMGPRGTKIPWSDARVAREELKNIQRNAPNING